MTNVKAGDLAICVSKNPQYHGRIVQVLHLAPTHQFILPNGAISVAPKHHPSWVLKAVGGPIPCLVNGKRQMVWYGVGADVCLRPLPGDPEEIPEQTEQPVSASEKS